MSRPLHNTSIPLTREGQNLTLTLEYDPLQVYAPKAYSSVLLVRNVDVKPDDVALDLGTGTGVYAIGIAMLGARHVVAVDISEQALETARNNAQLNNVAEQIDFRQGSMFDPLQEHERFSLIVSNPPCLPDPGEIDLVIPGTIMLSGSDGTQHATMLLEQGPDYLTPEGRIVFVYPSTSNPRKIFGLLDRYYNYEIIAEIEIPFYLHFLELWTYLEGLKAAGLSDFHEKYRVPYRTYWLFRARPK
ncbi:MAG: tRNA (adenine(22)-N(1))-methyltransferase TrmK [Anaerolineae bacterium]|nr:tRNA (adenine(22)-N(1))-methyltransferase TrmK [Anaerolineae bacterium]